MPANPRRPLAYPRAHASAGARVLAEQALSRAAGAPLTGGNSVRLLRDAAQNYAGPGGIRHDGGSWPCHTGAGGGGRIVAVGGGDTTRRNLRVDSTDHAGACSAFKIKARREFNEFSAKR